MSTNRPPDNQTQAPASSGILNLNSPGGTGGGLGQPAPGQNASAPAVPWQPTPGQPFRLEDLVPLRDRLIVQPLAVASRTEGGIHLVETSDQRERPQHGIVFAVGLGARTRDGYLYPPQAHRGDLVFYGKYSGQEIVIGSERFLNMSEAEVFSVLPMGHFIVMRHDDRKDDHLVGDYCDLCASPAELAAKMNLLIERERLVKDRYTGLEPGVLPDGPDGNR